MKGLLQFAAVLGELPPIVEFDHHDWPGLPEEPVNALCFQGLWLKGFDHYVVQDVAGDPVFVGWCDDPAQWAGQRWAQRIRFPPLFPDPAFGGRLNTRIEVEVFAEGQALNAWRQTGRPVSRFQEFETPAGRGVRHGVQLSDARFAAHVAALPRVDWKDARWR